ncbi:MAG: mobile mystery protein A [Bacteroidetes bacterium]|nr:MAG: mobile mystery protein A [Bacteroidota bacterium]
MGRFQIDSLELKTKRFRHKDAKALPSGGWVNAIRTSLGMTLNQLAKRVGTNASRINRIEQDELSGSVTLKTLQSVAAAMDSELVYAIVPNQKIESIIIERFRNKQLKLYKNVLKHMALEDQQVDEVHGLQALEKISLESINTKGLWDD